MREPCVYIMASGRTGTLYTGVTADLPRRAFEHREGQLKGFTKRYGCKQLVWYERHDRMLDAIGREKQIKGGSRAKKIELIEAMNPDWNDLYFAARQIGQRGAVIASEAKQSMGAKRTDGLLRRSAPRNDCGESYVWITRP